MPGGSIVPTLGDFDLETALRKQLDGKLRCTAGDECRIYLADEHYWLTPLKDVVDHIVRSKIYDINYRDEVMDCDDFATLLEARFIESQWINQKRQLPHAFGVVWGIAPGGGHAINIMLNSDGAVRFVEPQLPADADGAIMTVDTCDLSDIWMIRI